MKRRHVHTEVIPIRWGDMDAMGHVNNTIYFRSEDGVRRGRRKVVWVDFAKGKSVPLPDRIRQLVEG